MPPAVLTAEQTAARLPFPALCDMVDAAARDYAAGRITSPERQVLPLPEGGVLLSMPAAAADIAIHKLVNVNPANGSRGLPTIHGVVSVFDAPTGAPRLILDGPTVTARRTAAVSMLAIRTLLEAPPRHVALLGTGTQSAGHVAALASLFPGIRIDMHSRSRDTAAAFCSGQAGQGVDLRPMSGPVDPAAEVVIALTTSLVPIYDEAPRPGRLLVGVGAFKPEMAEFGPGAVHGSDLFVDDPAGARHEAGDLIQAGVDWSAVRSLVDALDGKAQAGRPRLFKSVGCAAWDLAAARCALGQG
ncbi:bifunctional Delta(1)-pyrroline-2-carboxylate/Delta(1)-piperideine-2-carboxylate reductase [Azospirillum picis]|uniref:1-piperideine-2-carboxylate/1-pyrroline-2-carboxylate reductase [NAD(P)H] n=1 Tax=Azospirillum picis TaxID=488438 RepID=A0ABU0MDM8_9PROT|nr:bifunctional Delta(1)-pyrroline-2-carboxylate/Delta(1)-piperideine-2-carboxylate reductase [Azospirillum picis]MBP2297443.1 1-piperideine-2-carboxylate/1-pyrroline-2-carboxylate reductase [NAD(P)H] [Azospirillum picis]MDQ0531534.1 1-piperideine-2-carboxylate/1-pyrroline-2-carboxylate reductase [NAD(P)H] [Azospirillum picis]